MTEQVQITDSQLRILQLIAACERKHNITPVLPWISRALMARLVNGLDVIYLATPPNTGFRIRLWPDLNQLTRLGLLSNRHRGYVVTDAGKALLSDEPDWLTDVVEGVRHYADKEDRRID